MVRDRADSASSSSSSSLQSALRSAFEGLEERRLLAASIVDGDLVVTGSNNNDSITVSINSTGSRYTVNINGKAQNFKAANVDLIRIDGRDGNDKIRFNEKSSRIGVKTVIDGGEGNDRITGSTRNDNIRADAGRDFVLAGKGNDKVQGGDGDDTLFGDAGNDRLYGQGHNDVIGGDDEGALVIVGKSIPKQVSGTDLLEGGDGDDWLLSGVRYERGPDDEGNANALTLLDDDDSDTMTGGAGSDVMGSYVSDDVFTDRNAAEDDVPSIDRRMPNDVGNHLHAQLNIRVRQSDGTLVRVVIPYAIGGTPSPAGLSNLDAVHTHGQSGRLHFEANDDDPYFMYELFENWSLPVHKRLFGRALNTSGAPITIKVTHENETKEAITDLANYQIQDEDVIVVTIG